MMTIQLNVPPTLKSLSFSTFPFPPLALSGSQSFLYPCQPEPSMAFLNQPYCPHQCLLVKICLSYTAFLQNPGDFPKTNMTNQSSGDFMPDCCLLATHCILGTSATESLTIRREEIFIRQRPSYTVRIIECTI